MENLGSNDQISKIHNVLNNLNVKMLRYDEHKKKVEDEIKRHCGQSRASMVSEHTLGELSEMISISDYQSVMESIIPTFRDQQETAKKEQASKKKTHTKNASSFSKTQNMNDLLKSINEGDNSQILNSSGLFEQGT